MDQELAREKAEFMAEVSAAFDRMMVEDPEQMLTFSQIERRGVELSREFGARLIQRRLKELDEAACVCCPRCKGEAQRCSDKRERRRLKSLSGPVEFERRKYRCARCRIRFFPHGRGTGTRD
jgi:hypothetical protein